MSVEELTRLQRSSVAILMWIWMWRLTYCKVVEYTTLGEAELFLANSEKFL
jgi:hypothetical protein